MAKIKSTVDLIMEKTKHLSLNAEEKAALEKRQLGQRVQAALTPYLKGERDVNFLAHELARLPPESAEEGKRLCVELLIDGLSPSENSPRILAAAGHLLGEAERERWEKTLVPIQMEARGALQKAGEQAADRCREALAEAGLRGPALLPRPDEEDRSWKEEKEQCLEAFHARVRKALRRPQM